MAGPTLLSDETIAAALKRKAEMEAAGVVCPFQVTFLTVEREPSYLHATLQSFLEKDPLAALLLPVNLMVGDTEAKAEYVRFYKEQGLARVWTVSAEEKERMETYPTPPNWRTHYRCIMNYYRCLTVNVDPDLPLLIFEDDISYTTNWFQKLIGFLDKIAPYQVPHFILSLYSYAPIGSDDGMAIIDPTYFYGGQGLYFPPDTRRDVAEFVRVKGVEECTAPPDLLVRNYCLETKRPLLGLSQSLVQHEGAVTTGLSPTTAPSHRSPTFVP